MQRSRYFFYAFGISFTLLFVLSQVVWAQKSRQHDIDSLTKRLPLLKKDTVKAITLNLFATNYLSINPERSIFYGRWIVALCDSLGRSDLGNNAYRTIGIAYYFKGNYDSAEIMLQKAISHNEKMHDFKRAKRALTDLGIVYEKKNDYVNALKTYLKALEISDARHLDASSTLGSIASLYGALGQPVKALYYDSLCVESARAHNDDHIRYLAMGNMASTLSKLKRYKQARSIFDECVSYLIKKGDEFYLANIYLAIANLDINERKFSQARIDAIKSASLFRKLKALAELPAVYSDLSIIELKLGDISKAEFYAKEGYAIADSAHLTEQENHLSLLLSKLSFYRHDLIAAAGYDSLNRITEDSLDLKNQKKAVADLAAKYETDKKQRENEILKKDKLLQEAAISKQRVFLFSGACVTALIILLLVIAYRSSKLLRNTNHQLIQQQRKVLDQKEEIEAQNSNLENALRHLQDTQEQLVHSEKMASLGQMTAGIAHEINNPVNFIQAGVEGLNENLNDIFQVLQEFDLTTKENFESQLVKIKEIKKSTKYIEIVPEINSLMKTIKNGTSRAIAIVSGLQRFSRKGKEEVVVKNVQELIIDTLVLVHGEIRAHGIEIEQHFDPSLSIECRPIEMGQAFLNILLNGMHAISSKGKIIISTTKINKLIEIRIRDNGKGISKEDISKIFDPFFTTKEVGKGTGLGLSITHGIIKNHHGEINVSSEVGVGTEFVITIPEKQTKVLV